MSERHPKIHMVNGLPAPHKSPPHNRTDATVLVNLPCLLFSVHVDYDGDSGDAFLHVFENCEVPNNGMVPTLPPIPITLNAMTVYALFPGVPMFQGVAVALSSTRDTLTKIATADAKFLAIYHPLDQ